MKMKNSLSEIKVEREKESKDSERKREIKKNWRRKKELKKKK